METRAQKAKRIWYRFAESKTADIGLVIVVLVVFTAIFAPWIAPHYDHCKEFVNFADANKAPCAQYLLGTDLMGRDILSRLIGSLRSTLICSVIVLVICVPVGFIVGSIAGYYKGTLIDTFFMRITDMFLALPSLVLAMAIAAVLEPSLKNSMIAVTVSWWPWYARLAYGVASSMKQENFIIYAELTGAKLPRIIIKEILPNCISSVLTKMTLDVGYVIITTASLSFAGLGEQAPKPALGNMISTGINYLPESWWMTIFPAITIILIVLGFNLLGDGISNIFNTEGN